jgi:hypothetical protein
VLVHGVEPAPRATRRGFNVLVFPPAVDETQGSETTERSVDRDLLDAQAVRDLEPVELGATLLVDAHALEQHTRVELEHESTSRSGHRTPHEFRRAITP